MSSIRLTDRLLRAIVAMACIASAGPAEGDYADADVDGMVRAGDWAAEQLNRRRAARKRAKLLPIVMAETDTPMGRRIRGEAEPKEG